VRRAPITRDDFDQMLVAQIASLRQRAGRLCRDQDVADDLVQDTLERALANRTRFRPGTELRSWLTTIMHNLFLDGRRRQQVRSRSIPALVAHAAEWAGASTPLSRWRRVDEATLHTAVCRLAAPLRTTLELHVRERLSHRALGARLHAHPSTIATRLHRARRQLRVWLTGKIEATADR
jgi:RNA polymerase sigma-70 factor, ECF subfamily